MPRYIFEINGQRHIFEGPDPQTTQRFAQQWAADPRNQNPDYARGASLARTPLGAVGAGAETFLRSVPFATEAQAGLNAGVTTAANAFSGQPANFGQAWTQQRQSQQGQVDQFRADHPILAPLITGTGYGAQAAVAMASGGASEIPAASAAARPFLARAGASLARNAVTGGTVAGINAAAQPGTLAERGQAATNAIPVGAAVGAAVPAAIGAVTRRAGVPATATAQGALKAENIPLTPGQNIGGGIKTLEDQATSLPITGAAITGARQRGVEALNRAFANRALAPVDQTLPASVAAGHDAIAHVQQVLGQKYDQAAGLLSGVHTDPQLAEDIDAITENLRDYPKAARDQFDDIVHNRIEEPLATGSASGQQFINMTSQLRSLASNYAGSDTYPGLSNSLNDLHDAVTDLGARQSPEYADAKQAVDQGYATFKQMQRAGQAAATRDGVASVAQLKAAVRNSDNSVDNGRYAAGQALNQDLVRNADQVMGGNYPDSGSAGRWGTMALLASAANPYTGAAGIPAVATLGAGAVPYMLAGRSVANAFERADPAATIAAAQGLGRQINAMTAEPLQLPHSITSLSLPAAAMAGADADQQPAQ